jgi:hypothetical protein
VSEGKTTNAENPAMLVEIVKSQSTLFRRKGNLRSQGSPSPTTERTSGTPQGGGGKGQHRNFYEAIKIIS